MARRMVGMSEYRRVAGESHPGATLTDREIDEIRSLHEDEGVSYSALAFLFGVPKSTIAGICQYRRRTARIVEWRRAKEEV